ncbi:MAG: peptide chain release factor N(5)-glutamine methyltransferase [Treponema sp.]|nr:peptide chain release factor N(5)-glutamine methyltransferase [Treponema sp.]
MKRHIAALLDTSPTPQLDADCILQWILHCDKTQLLLRRNEPLTAAQVAAAQEAAATRRTGFPIAYITGRKAFFGNDFYVTPAVLIPKPDTELLVEQTIVAVRAVQAARPQEKIAVCDMCAGSGCVGISVLCALGGGISLTLVDVSADALQVARTNVRRLLVPAVQDDVRFVQSDLFAHVPQTFQVIAANPPYVPHTQARELLRDGRSEPLLALDGDVTERGEWSGTEDGLALIRRFVLQAYTHLADGGMLLVETGEYNARETAACFAQAGLKDIRIEKDLCGQLRNVIGRK